MLRGWEIPDAMWNALISLCLQLESRKKVKIVVSINLSVSQADLGITDNVGSPASKHADQQVKGADRRGIWLFV